MNIAIISAGPISGAISNLSDFFGKFVSALSGGLDPSTSKWLVDQSVYFQVLGLVVLLIKFYIEIMKANAKRGEGDKIYGAGAAFLFLGFRLAWIPVVVLASAIPGMFLRMTPSAFAATTGTAKSVAAIGDGLIQEAGNYWTMTIQGGARRTLTLSPDDLKNLTPDQVASWKTIKQGWDNAAGGQAAAKQAYEAALGNGANKATLTQLQNKMLDAQAIFVRANTLLTAFSGSIAQRLTKEGQVKVQADKELEMLRKLPKDEVVETIITGEGADYTITAGQKIEALNRTITDASAPKTFSAWDVPGILAEALGSIGFYACCLPALIGIIAGAVMALKEALAVLQFGAKVDVMKGLALTFASFFAPLFMLTFLFPKTEQFGWKFVSFLFSVYFGVCGISYACGVVANVGFGALANTVSSLVAVPTGYLPKEASQPLFMASLGIGLTALGVGMVTAFAADIVKSALQVGQGPFNGNFNA